MMISRYLDSYLDFIKTRWYQFFIYFDLSILMTYMIIQVQKAPYLAPCNFFLFLKLKIHYKNKIWGCERHEKKICQHFLTSYQKFSLVLQLMKSLFFNCILILFEHTSYIVSIHQIYTHTHTHTHTSPLNIYQSVQSFF